tara:strand:- start:4193 stop:5134 length:942 start_codon:yes stop_codon:yes gene_type:complete
MLMDLEFETAFMGNYSKFAGDLIRSARIPILPSPEFNSWNHAAVPHYLAAGAGVMLDSYQLTADRLSKVSRVLVESPLCVLDDFAEHKRYDCDGLINFTVSAKSRIYPEGPAKLFLGPEFFPARRWLREVRTARQSQDKRVPQPQNFLVIAGGNDREGVTLRLLSALSRISPQAHVCVLTAAAANQDLEKVLSGFSTVNRLKFCPDLREPMLWADACLCGGGLTKYECAFVGLPVAALAQTAEQQADTEVLASAGAAFDLGLSRLTTDEDLEARLRLYVTDCTSLKRQIDCGRQLVGARNPQRVAEPFLQLVS